MNGRSTATRGFTLIEVLMSLAILAMLMAAVGAAFHASMKNYSDNEALFKSMNTARQALLRITTDLRTATWVGRDGVDDTDNRQCSIVGNNGDDITYHCNLSSAASYDASLDDETLYLIINAGPSAGTYRLCDNVTEMTFVRAVKDGVVRNVRVSMTVASDNRQLSQTLDAAAVVRAAMPTP